MTRALAALLGLAMIPAGLFLLFGGGLGLWSAFARSPAVDFAGDLFEAVLLVIIGLLMTGFGGRWIWLALRPLIPGRPRLNARAASPPA